MIITDRLQTQNSEINKNLIMTHPAWQDKPDLIGQYGCLLVAKCNAFNMYKKNSALLTVRNLNKLIIDRKGYNYLYHMDIFNGDLDKVRKECFNKESFQIHPIVNSILGIEKEERKYMGLVDINSLKDYFIIKTKYKNTGHYSLIMRSNLYYWDSYNGGLVKPFADDVLEIIKITFA
jgi:hypothetical protein